MASGAAHSQPSAGNTGASYQIADEVSYDDNLFRLPGALKAGVGDALPGKSADDYINRISLGVDGHWVLSRQSLDLEVRGEDNRFARNDYLDNVSGTGKVVWNWVVGSRFSGQLGGDYRRALASFANTRLFVKDLVDTSNSFVAAKVELGSHWSLKGGARHAESSHSAEVRSGDDFEADSGILGVEYATSLGDTLGWEYRFTQGTFADDVVLNGLLFNRNYEDNTASFRLQYGLGAKTTLDASVGYIKRGYPTPRIEGTSTGEFSGDIWNMALQWRPTVKAELKLAAWRDLRANLDAQSDYFISNGVSLAPAWKPVESLSLSMKLSHEDQDYVGSSVDVLGLPLRQDRVTIGHLAVTYQPRQFLQFDLSYNYEQRDSNRPLLVYEDKTVTAGVVLAF